MKVLVGKYPESEVKEPAQEILEFLASKKTATSPKDSLKVIATEESSLYKYKPEMNHVYMMVIESKNVNINEIKILISNFNSKNNSIDNLSTSSVILDISRQIVTVSSFSGKDKIIAYITALSKDKKFNEKMAKVKYLHYGISIENYTTFYKDKNTDILSKFFDKNYMN